MSDPIHKDAPAFDFYPERWLAGVAEFSDAEQLAYLRLLCYQWLNQGVPEEIEKLRRLAGKGVTPALLTKFPVGEDGKRRNPRLETVRAEQRARIEKKKEQRRNAANKRWHPESIPAGNPPHCELNATALRPHNGSTANAMPTTHPSPPTRLERESSAGARAGEMALQADAIAAAYCRQDSPMEVRQCILDDLNAGTAVETLRQGVLRCMAFIRTAPGGSSNRFVPTARKFFELRQWRSPEAFQERWKKDSGALSERKAADEIPTVAKATQLKIL